MPQVAVLLTADEISELTRGLTCRMHFMDTDQAVPLLALMDRLNAARDLGKGEE